MSLDLLQETKKVLALGGAFPTKTVSRQIFYWVDFFWHNFFGELFLPGFVFCHFSRGKVPLKSP